MADNITQILQQGFSPTLTVSGRKGRFNFNTPPQFSQGIGSGKSPMFRFETDTGDIFFHRLEKDKQGGRWDYERDKV